MVRVEWERPVKFRLHKSHKSAVVEAAKQPRHTFARGLSKQEAASHKSQITQVPREFNRNDIVENMLDIAHGKWAWV